MSIEVRQTAELARIRVPESEQAALAEQLQQILDYVALLDEVETRGVERLVHAVELTNAFRDDTVAPSLTRDAALQNAPAVRDGCFFVPDVLQREGS